MGGIDVVAHEFVNIEAAELESTISRLLFIVFPARKIQA